MNQITLKSIGELLEYNFFIPSYQRGYRWTEQQISDLLDDVNEFSPKELIGSNEKTWYCLQPIVVKRKSENQLEVIDGQQRLTTIYMILHYLNQGYVEMRRKKLFGIKYETRELSAAFLNEKLNYNVVDESNIDFFFISKGYKKISEWFKNKGQQFDINYFESKFNTHTKMIWYEIAEHVNPIDVFTRINSGKIPLTNAELIKALFLKSSNFDNTDTEKIQLRQLEIATEWDRMEYALQDDGFWYFINKEENNHATRIEFIFDLMSEHTQATDEYHTFRYFKEKFNDINENAKSWIEIKKIFQYLEEWYHDRELYHKIGYLITTRTNIKTILAKKIEKKNRNLLIGLI